MSETNENPQDRLERLEATQVRLMTDFEVFWAKHEKWVEEQEREWERQQERWRQYDLQRENDRNAEKARGEELDRRIAALVSGIGEFMRKDK